MFPTVKSPPPAFCTKSIFFGHPCVNQIGGTFAPSLIFPIGVWARPLCQSNLGDFVRNAGAGTLLYAGSEEETCWDRVRENDGI